MAKRGDNIRKRKDGRWEGRYKKERAVDGCIIYGSVYGKTYKEVKEKMAAIISHPLQLATPKGQGKTFGEVLNLWMDNNRARLKGGTINKYQNLIDTHIMPELGQTKINELSATRINTFLNEKISRGRVDGSGGLSASYVRSIMLVINAAIKYAVSEQLCSPLKTPICKPSADKTELSILSAEEQKKLEASLLNNFDLTGAGIYISLHTGLRIGEVCSLTWNDIDMNKRVIHVRHTVARIRSSSSAGFTILVIDTPKTKASKRDIPISSTLLPIKEPQTEPIPEESKPEQDEMSENAIAWPVVDFAALESINSDCVAWIRIDGTEIDYPVVQGHDNSFYLKHLFDGEWNGAGCIFLDSRVNPDLSDRHSVLYGHHMKNGTMFSDIAKYKDQTFYENHTTGMILTPTENYRIEFFAGYVAGADDENAWKVTFATEDKYVDWLNETVGRSWFNSEVIPTAEDRVITLSTCSYEFNNARFVLIGRLK